MIVTDGGSRIEMAVPGTPVAPGATLFVSVRRDRIAVGRAPTGPRPADLLNAIAGEVHAIENQGSYVKVTIDLGTDEEFVAQVPDEDYSAIRSTSAIAWWRAR